MCALCALVHFVHMCGRVSQVLHAMSCSSVCSSASRAVFQRAAPVHSTRVVWPATCGRLRMAVHCHVHSVTQMAGVSPSMPVPALPFLRSLRCVFVFVFVCLCVCLCVWCARMGTRGTGLVRKIQKLRSPACGEAGCDCTRGNQNASAVPCTCTDAPEKCACKEQQHARRADARALVDSGDDVKTLREQDTAQRNHGSEAGGEGGEEKGENEEAEVEEEEEDEMRPYYINDWANFTGSRERILDMAKLCAESFSLPQSDLQNPFALYTQRS